MNSSCQSEFFSCEKNSTTKTIDYNYRLKKLGGGLSMEVNLSNTVNTGDIRKSSRPETKVERDSFFSRLEPHKSFLYRVLLNHKSAVAAMADFEAPDRGNRSTFGPYLPMNMKTTASDIFNERKKNMLERFKERKGLVLQDRGYYDVDNSKNVDFKVPCKVENSYDSVRNYKPARMKLVTVDEFIKEDDIISENVYEELDVEAAAKKQTASEESVLRSVLTKFVALAKSPKSLKLNRMKNKKNNVREIVKRHSGDSAEYDLVSVTSPVYHTLPEETKGRFNVTKIVRVDKDMPSFPVEEYLEPNQIYPDYEDVENSKAATRLGAFLRRFEYNFRTKEKPEREQEHQIHAVQPKSSKEQPRMPQLRKSEGGDRPLETLQKWNESFKSSVKWKKGTNMADRPLPVPVENEFYYMEVNRAEAEKLLEGHADGTFILRPSSKAEHTYSLSVIFSGVVYNIGCRKRPDNRLALGFAKPYEQSFVSIRDLIEHYYAEKLILVSQGHPVGTTHLRKLN